MKGWLLPSRSYSSLIASHTSPNDPSAHRGTGQILCGPINPLLSNLILRGEPLLSTLRGKERRDPTALSQLSPKDFGEFSPQILPIQYFYRLDVSDFAGRTTFIVSFLFSPE